MTDDAAPPMSASSPAGGSYSTVGELATLLAALNDGHMVTPKTLSALLMMRVDPAGGDDVYGYGFNVRTGFPHRVGHGGGAPGINAEIALYRSPVGK